MPYMGEARDFMIDALDKSVKPSIAGITHIGLLYSPAGTERTFSSTNGEELELPSGSHPYGEGQLVEIFSIGSGGSGLIKAGYFFYIKSISGTKLKLSQISDVTKNRFEKWSPDVSGLVLREMKEHPTTGFTNNYGRKAVTWGTTEKGSNKDTVVPKTITLETGRKVDAVAAWSAATAGTMLFAEKVFEETIGATPAYTVSEVKTDLTSV